MSEFEVLIYKPEILPHPNADLIELCQIGGYQSIIQKHSIDPEKDLVAYIPEKAIVPRWLLKFMGLEGKLAGKSKDRVKAIKLRGVLSQGICYPVEDGLLKYMGSKDSDLSDDWYGKRVQEGDHVTELLCIEKYEPPIPIHFSSNKSGAPDVKSCEHTIRYEIENIKKYNEILIPGEEIIITEKIHGTWCCLGYEKNYGNFVTSKGLSAKGLVYDLDKNPRNIYIDVFEFMKEKLNYFQEEYFEDRLCCFLGELHGGKIQDLNYGLSKPELRIFDIFVSKDEFSGLQEERNYLDMSYHVGQKGYFLDYHKVIRICDYLGLKTMPILYQGPYDEDIVVNHTKGKTSHDGKHIREGIVIKTDPERIDSGLGRVILKSINEDYLLRKGGTEYE